VDDYILDQTLDDCILWDNFTDIKKFMENVSATLKRTESWSEEVLIFESSEGSRIEVVLVESNEIEEVTVRIDMRREGLDFISFLSQLSSSFDLLAVLSSNRIVNIDPETFITIVKSSEEYGAYQFWKNSSSTSPNE
jgi:hypothetical protein